ncbi:MAG: M56 family metallopeptidase [Gemmatimonadota bacterium]|nr:M56 family metallopeptidase [Gemmatimonadota bacterium]
MVEVSLFILLVWAVDRWLTLETRLRYALYLLALAKVFVPPVLAIPIPAFLVSPAGVVLDESVYSGVVSGAVAVSPEPVTTFPPAFYLFCLWTLSVLVWTGVALWKNAAFRRTLRSANPVDLASEVPSLNAPRNLDIFSKTDLPSPILVGLIRPRLFLPAKWSSWTPEELRGVVRHELAHFERRDIHVLILQAMATALFGVNPLIWLLNRRLMLIRELRCDEAVLRETNLTPAEYGRLLLGLVDRRPAPRALTVFFTDRGTTLKNRLEHVLGFKEGRIKRSKRQLAALVLVGLAIVPLSIREAYTQDENGLKLSKSAVGETTDEATNPQEPKSVTGQIESNEIAPVVYDVNEVDEKPRPVNIIGPKIPEEAPIGNTDVVVLLKVIVNVDGSVSEVTVLKGPEVFHKAATDAALQWRFKPAVHEGRVVPVSLLSPMRFSPKPQVTLPPLDTVYSRLERAFELGAVVDEEPVIIHSVPPVYPENAQEAGRTINVLLKFKVNVDGSVSDVRVSSVKEGPLLDLGHRGDPFRRSAVDAISQYRFTPAQQDGKPVPVWMTYNINFKMPDQTAAPPSERSDLGGEKVFEFWDVDVKPILMHSVAPVYPNEAKTEGLSGNVFLKFKVNVDGSVSDVRDLRGQVIFVKPAIDAISQFRFKPAERKGKPVAVWMTQAIKFMLPKHGAALSSDAGDTVGLEEFHITSVDVKPAITHAVQPNYPDVARRNRLTGIVLLHFKVNVDGSVSDVRALRGRPMFVQPAIDAISQYRFSPAQREGKPVPAWITHTITFELPPKTKAVPPSDRSDVGDDKVFEFWDVDVKPVNVDLRTVQPVYPDHARESGLTGNVFLKFKINVDGSVSDAEVLKGDEVFRQSAIDAVNQFRFKPAEIGGKPVPVWMSQRVSFQLDNPPQELNKGWAPTPLDTGLADILEIDQVETKPHPVHIIGPKYPEEAYRKKVEGVVYLKFIVNVDSSVSDVTVLKGPEIFHQPAIEAVLQFRFRPAKHRGEVVKSWLILPMGFSLK